MPISSAVWRFQPGSVKIGGTWQVAHLALLLKRASPFAAAALSKVPSGGLGVGSES